MGLTIFVLSIIIIIIGFLMVILGIMLWGFQKVISFFKFLVYIVFSIYDIKKVQNKLGDANWSKEEWARIEQIENSKRPKIEKKARTNVYLGILVFISDMKAKYPNADEKVFEKIEANFLKTTSLNFEAEYEEKIRKSHIINTNLLED